MRVVHISTYDVDGGAARAAFRLHESLLAAGQQSTMLTRVKHSGADSVHQVPRKTTLEVILGELVEKNFIDQNRTPLSTTWFSLGWPGDDLSTHPAVLEADVIHLHWVSGFVSPTSVKALLALGKPLVWSLHDQRAFTGGCHYSAGCQQFETGCEACPQLVSDPCRLTATNIVDQSAIFGDSNITVVAPSQWMADCARRSAVFRRSRIERIPYGIDIQRFQATPQQEARAHLVLPRDNFLLLFGVDNFREKRKGVRELFAMLEACGQDERVRALPLQDRPGLLCFGDLDLPAQLPLPVRSFGRVRCDKLLSSLYAAADLFLLPSLEDNLPNTILESMSCGTPVGAFNSGGIVDLVQPNRTGFLTPSGDVDGLRQMVLESASNLPRLRGMRPACREYIETHFSYATQARNFVTLYESLTSRGQHRPRKEERTAVGPDPGPQFQRNLALVLKTLFDANQKLLASCETLGGSQMGSKIRQRLTRQVRRILKRAVRDSWKYDRLRTALAAEFAIVQAPGEGAVRLLAFVKRVLRLKRSRLPAHHAAIK